MITKVLCCGGILVPKGAEGYWLMRIHSTPDLGALDTTGTTEAASSGVMREFELMTHTPRACGSKVSQLAD